MNIKIYKTSYLVLYNLLHSFLVQFCAVKFCQRAQQCPGFFAVDFVARDRLSRIAVLHGL